MLRSKYIERDYLMKYSRSVEELYYPPICEFKGLAAKLLKQDLPIFDLNQAVPDYLPPDTIKQALISSVENKMFPYYTPDEGLPAFRKSVLKELSNLYECSISENQLVAVAGANNGFFSVLGTIAEAGDEIILLSPYYFNHFMASRIFGVEPILIVQNPEENFPIPMEEIEKNINKKTRAIVLVNPSNPTGRSYSQEEINKLYTLCKTEGILLISDEVYNYFHIDYPKPASVLNVPQFWENSVAIHSYSKTFSLTGYRIGFVVAGENFIHQFMKVHDTNLICAPRIGQLLAIEGLCTGKTWLENKISMLKQRLELFTEAMNKKSSLFRIVSSGAFFVYVKYDRADKDCIEVCKELMRKENIVALPGSFFGPGQESFIRFALGNISEQKIPELVNKLHRYS